jgi:hypothetical protein
MWVGDLGTEAKNRFFFYHFLHLIFIRTDIPRKGIARPQSQFPHSSVCDLHIPKIGLPILLQENMWTDPGNIYV